MRVEFTLPDLGEGLTEAEITDWLVATGDTVALDQPLVEVETAKAIMQISCPTAGVVLELGGKPGDVLAVGAMLTVFDDGSTAAVPAEPPVIPAAARRRVLASPATRAHATAIGVDLLQVTGSGPAGRVTRDDVDRTAAAAPGFETRQAARVTTASRTESAAAQEQSAPSAQPAAIQAADEEVPLRGIRRQIARTMTASWQQIPHVTEFREVDASRLVDALRALRERAPTDGPRLTFLPILALACTAALARFPIFNASLDMEREIVSYHRSVHLGIATSSQDGLLVPVLRDADRLDLFGVSRGIADLAGAVRSRTARPEQLASGTFTISNFGSYGTWLGTPIINPPQSAIAGFGRIADTVVAVDGQPVVRPTLPIAVSADHRIVDGDQLGAFVGEIADLLRNPVLLLGRVR